MLHTEMSHMNILYMVYLGENHRHTFFTYTDVYMLPIYTYICNYLPYLYVCYTCYICLSIYAIHEFVYMSHTYTYTYVTYLHKHI